MKLRSDVCGTEEPSPFEKVVMDETGSTLAEIRALSSDEFDELCRECVRERNQRRLATKGTRMTP